MKILLIVPPKPENSPFYLGEHRPSTGLGFLSSALKVCGHQVFLLDLYVEPYLSVEETVWAINPDWIGVTINTVCYTQAMALLHQLRDIRERWRPEMKIVVGGCHVTLMPQTIPDWVDHKVVGEGESALADLVNGVTEKHTVEYPFLEDLNELLSPDWELFMDTPYNWKSGIHEEGIGASPLFNYCTSRGCPFACSFCSASPLWGRRWRAWDAERIFEEVEMVRHRYGAQGIYFREDNFTIDYQRVVRFCELMIQNQPIIPWIIESRVDTIDMPLLNLMHDAGCRWIYFGVESGSQKVLDDMKKGITVEQIENCFRWCKEMNVKAYASWCLGTPTETNEDIKLTESLQRRMKADSNCNNGLVPLPGSPLYNYYLAHPELIDHITDNFLIITKRYLELKRRHLIV